MINIETLKEDEFLETLGVRKATFEKMLEVLNEAYETQRQKAGRPFSKLSVTDKLVVALLYLREYRTMHSLAVDYGVVKSTIFDAIRWVENILIKCNFLHIEGKKVLLNAQNPLEVILVDVMECEIERPTKNQKKYYSGKKKRHTIKVQIIIDKATGKVIAIFTGAGRIHDFQLFKNSNVHIVILPTGIV